MHASSLRHAGRAALAALLACVAAAAGAQSFPTKAVTIVVPFPPAGGADTLARMLAPKLSALWGGQSVIVENRPGASGRIGTEQVANASPDGHMLVMASTAAITEKNVGRLAPVALVSAEAVRRRAQRQRADRQRARSDRLREDKSRQAPLRLVGRRRRIASLGRALQGAGARRSPARSLQGDRPGADRPSRRPDRRDVRADADRDPAAAIGPPQGDRGHRHAPARGAPQRADGRRVGAARRRAGSASSRPKRRHRSSSPGCTTTSRRRSPCPT